ncbi:uncharacterized protein [Littorina saxatilis]
MDRYQHLEESEADYPSDDDDDYFPGHPPGISNPGGWSSRALHQPWAGARISHYESERGREGPPSVGPRRPVPIVTPRYNSAYVHDDHTSSRNFQQPDYAAGPWLSQRGRPHDDRTFENEDRVSQADPSGFPPPRKEHTGYQNSHPSLSSQGFSYTPNSAAVRSPQRTNMQSQSGDRVSVADSSDAPAHRRAALDPSADRTSRQSQNPTKVSSNADRPHVAFDKARIYKVESDTMFSDDLENQTYKDEDLADLEYLDNRILLEELMKRFNQHQPYTYVGDSLVAVNPCMPLDIYTEELHDKYQNLHVRSSEPAHIFWVAAQVYRNLLTTGSSQCVVVGGDSGAGKTESTKYILHHLVRNGAASKATSSKGREPLTPDIVGKIEKVNPLLELFGNASTVLNENSSRFGKLVELEYDDQGTLTTARLECFVLEKFRVTSRNPVERNFHVFYALFAGLSEQRLTDLGLDLPAESYRILAPRDQTEGAFRSQEEEESYKARCAQLNSTLPDVGFSQDEIDSLFKCLAAILLITNVEFERWDPDHDETLVLDSEGELCLANAVDVLGLEDVDEFRNSLLQVNMEVKGERMVRQKTLRQARDGRDALARELYSVLFYGIIDKINLNLRQGTSHTSSSRNPCIRLLDISGFENVEGHNGFEQFVINSTNEKLHQFFLQHTFRKELKEYEHEGLPGVDVDFTDNDDIVHLIFSKPEGLIPLLEDEISTNGSDRGWVVKCGGRTNPSDNFTAIAAHTAFKLTHYAGQVEYTAEGFVTKNSDTLPHNLREVVLRSENTFITEYFSMGSDAAAALHRFAGKDRELAKRTGKLTGRFTDQYLKSLSGMMTKLHTATPVFVRCIKPNVKLLAGRFDSEVVKDQLQSSGLLEFTQIRKDGYPIRVKFAHFVKRYKDLLDNADVMNLRREDQLRQTCDVILSTAGVTRYKLGHSKVFLKMYHRDQLEHALDQKAKEREESVRKERERERAAKGEDDMSSTTTDQLSAASNSSESGFASGHYQTTVNAHEKGKDILIEIPENNPDDKQDEEEEKEKKRKDKKKKEGLGNQPAYNIFRLTERDFESSTEFEMKIRRCVRLLLYLIIFCFILAGGVVARISLTWLGSDQLKHESTTVIRSLLERGTDIKKFQVGLAPTRLLICQLLPLLIAWMSCFFKVLFGRKDWPTFRAIILVTILDCAGVVGRSVFLFKVLPSTDTFTAIVLGTAVCQVPAILKLTSLILLRNTSLEDDIKTRNWRRIKHYLHVVLVFFALLVQFGVVPVLYFGGDIISAVTGTRTNLQLPPLWSLIVAALCSSLGWWENYAYGRTPVHKSKQGSRAPKTMNGLSMWRIEMGRVRQTSFVYTGPVQMVVLLALFFSFNENGIDVVEQVSVIFSSFGRGFSDSRVLSSHFIVYSLVYMQIAGTFITAYMAGIACRLYMQRFAFALPILLVAPASIGMTLGCTPTNLDGWFELSNSCVTADLSEAHVLLKLILGVLVCLSTVIINTHIWFPEVERTAKMERLFAFPHRDPIFSDVCLQCSRRQDKLENAERNRRQKKSDGKSKEGVERPTVYICATMWHEIRNEMLQLLKSLFRIDFDVYTRKKAMSQFDVLEEYSDLYDPEIHIIFDDAFEKDPKTKQKVLNAWVRQFIEVMPEAMGSVAKRNIDLNAPTKMVTPYGGRLKWVLPGGTVMHVHLKDKERIRHRKRWSQILYLYYLLGYRLMGDYRNVDDALTAGGSVRKRGRRHRVRKNTSLLNNLSPSKVRQADNIFLMTLDGDVDFRPEAVRLLLDRMKKNKQVAAVCGRIHPIGDGPMVWYQQFEYAVGHWLQKAAEHVFGCVLCCPGCFSLFRGSALMDDNVMKMYTTEPTEAIHFIQYEQGEDRWLCTLLLQQGWKIEYCAGADALTFAPETFNDFYIQRRRWSPSTMANIIDLIGSWRITVKMNDNISILFMLYQFVLMSSSILAPGLVVYMIAGSYNAVLELGLWESYFLSVGPVFLYVVLCLKAKTETQIAVAAAMSAVYTVVMLLVTVGTIINVATASIVSPDVLFLICVAVIFIVAGFVHPNELFCLFHGILYYVTVPSTFVFLTVFFLCNLHVVSWGTREGPKKVEPVSDGQQPVMEKGKLYKFFEKLGLTAIAGDIRTFAQQMMGIRQDVVQQSADTTTNNNNQQGAQNPPSQDTAPKKVPPPVAPKPEPVVELDDTYWTRELDIPNSRVEQITEDEVRFWKFLLEEYLQPIKPDKEKQDKIADDLLSARNNVVFAYMLLNLMFTLVLLQLKLQMDKLKDTFYIAGEYEPVSTVSLIIFSMLLLTQFMGMMGHRWGTFMHLIASTKLTWFLNNEEEERALTAIQEAQKLTSAGAEGDIDIMNPDYSDDDETGDDFTVGPSTNVTPSMSSNDLEELAEEHDGEEAPDYTESEEEDEDEEEEEETDFGGQRSVQYDSVFDKRFKSVRKHIERQNKPTRTPLFQKNTPAAVARKRDARHLERRQSLYLTTKGAPWGNRRGSFFFA